jgi:integrase
MLDGDWSSDVCSSDLAALKTVLRLARDEWMYIDVIPRISLAKETGERTKMFNQEELDKIHDWLNLTDEQRVAKWNCEKPWSERRTPELTKIYHNISALFTVLLDTGMRVGEALSLDVKRNVLFDEKPYGSIRLYPDQCKTSKPRKFPMTPTVHKILKDGPNRPFPYKQDHISRVMKRIRTWWGVGDDHEWVVHSLRHTFASRMLNAGVDIYVVSKLMGHSSVAVTTKYAHEKMELKVAAFEAVMNRYGASGCVSDSPQDTPDHCNNDHGSNSVTI